MSMCQLNSLFALAPDCQNFGEQINNKRKDIFGLKLLAQTQIWELN